MSRPLQSAIERARADATERGVVTQPDGRPRTRRLAIGDPQAPLDRFLGILDRHGLLASDGRLRPEVFLVSMGDHFDWGSRDDRERAAEDGLALLSWLAAHPPDQVVLLLGNHDLGRVGELARFDDRSFALARSEADVIYDASSTKKKGEEGTGREGMSTLEARFRSLHPDLPTTEVAARDFSAFRAAQRSRVEALLRTRRFRIAHAAAPRLMLQHAGVTIDELDALGVPERSRADANAVASALNAALDGAVDAWDGKTPLSIGVLHVPGSAADGEGRGIFYQRPSDPAHEDAALFAGPPRRRYDPRRLPRGLVQAIGHIRDAKCRTLLPGWHDGSPAQDGPLRHLVTDGTTVRYARGTPASWAPDTSGILFTDGGMNHADPASYELLDLVAVRAA